MFPKKILDLRKFAGLPNYLVFTDDGGVNKPYSSWDAINNYSRLVDINVYRKYDVIFSSKLVRDRCLQAIWHYECVLAHCVLSTASCDVHLFDVAKRDTFIDCCKFAPVSDKDYVLIIHEIIGYYLIVSANGAIVEGYISEDLTYDRR